MTRMSIRLLRQKLRLSKNENAGTASWRAGAFTSKKDDTRHSWMLFFLVARFGRRKNEVGVP